MINFWALERPLGSLRSAGVLLRDPFWDSLWPLEEPLGAFQGPGMLLCDAFLGALWGSWVALGSNPNSTLRTTLGTGEHLVRPPGLQSA